MPQLQRQALAVHQVTFPPTEDVGAPRSAGGGGTRGGGGSVEACVKSKTPPLTVVAPNNNLWTTVSATPTLFWYVPPNNAESANFEIYDSFDDDNVALYQTNLPLKGTGGVVKLSLPPTVSLEPGKTYRWRLRLVCDTEGGGLDQTVGGVIKRTELSSAQKSQVATARQPLQKVEAYAKAGVWQETLMTLAQLRHDRPNDRTIEKAWKELLNSVGLNAIADQPLVDCCKPLTDPTELNNKQ
ncbi:MAG TPA: DUF928 domain-containing protein [Coleofasciculaceae cyanobacterium]